jgi:ABC-type phosphate/phosphonate transport system substrate-binding protein
VSEAPAIGDAERPITVYFALPEDRRTTSVRQIAHQLAQQLTDNLGLSLSVELSDEKTALDLLCSGAPALAWVSAFTYAAARQECEAMPWLAVKRGRSPSFTIGQSAEIVARNDIADLAQLGGQVFCRSADQDVATAWVLPALLLSSAGVNPFIDLEAIRDYPDDASVILALQAGECAAAALRPGDFDQALLDAVSALADTEGERPDYNDLKEALHIIVPAADVTAPATTGQWRGMPAGILPYEVLVSAPESALPPELRASLVEQITAFFTDRVEGTNRTRRLLDADGILPVSAQHYRSFVTMVEQAGWRMAFFP